MESPPKDRSQIGRSEGLKRWADCASLSSAFAISFTATKIGSFYLESAILVNLPGLPTLSFARDKKSSAYLNSDGLDIWPDFAYEVR